MIISMPLVQRERKGKQLRGSDLIKSGMAVVGVAKFLGCEKTLVKNPSEAVGPY